LEALGLNLGYLFVQIFNFAIIFVVLRAWVYKPVLGLLERRRESIAQGLEDARIASEARDNAEKEAQKIISEAQTEATQKIREATERAEAAARDIRAEAEKDAHQAREEALEEAEEERNRMLSDVRGQIAALAMAAAQKLVGEALDEQRQHALIDEFFSGVKAGRVVVLEEDSFKEGVAAAEVTSAVPLTQQEQETVKQDILHKIGEQATVTFRVDPSIMGGLVIRVGDKVLDGSVAGRLESMRQNVQ
jgi:F-type H+-transporting ATPase subunit b